MWYNYNNKKYKELTQGDMIAHLKGKIIFKNNKYIVLETHGIGFKVFLAEKNLEKLEEKEGEEIEVFTYLDINERSFDLYGFLEESEKSFFKVVKEIPGVGAKSALEICSIASPEKIKEEIEKGNTEIFKNIPRIGAKKARKIIAELAANDDIFTKGIQTSKNINANKKVDEEALIALINLGFKKKEAQTALEQIDPEVKDPKEKVKQALKVLRKQ